MLEETEMCKYIGSTQEGNFKDLDTGKDISIRTVLYDIVNNMEKEDFNTLTDDMKYKFVRLMGRFA